MRDREKISSSKHIRVGACKQPVIAITHRQSFTRQGIFFFPPSKTKIPTYTNRNYILVKIPPQVRRRDPTDGAEDRGAVTIASSAAPQHPTTTTAPTEHICILCAVCLPRIFCSLLRRRSQPRHDRKVEPKHLFYPNPSFISTQSSNLDPQRPPQPPTDGINKRRVW